MSEEKGILDLFVEDICKDIEIRGAIESTRDENGKVDPAAAAGIVAGLGHTSLEDLADLDVALAMEGAFDPDDNFDESNETEYDSIPQIRSETTNEKAEPEKDVFEDSVFKFLSVILTVLFVVCVIAFIVSGAPLKVIFYLFVLYVIALSFVYRFCSE